MFGKRYDKIHDMIFENFKIRCGAKVFRCGAYPSGTPLTIWIVQKKTFKESFIFSCLPASSLFSFKSTLVNSKILLDNFATFIRGAYGREREKEKNVKLEPETDLDLEKKR